MNFTIGHAKRLLAFCGLVPVCVHAQSSTTLFGVIDEGVRYTSNAGGKRLFDTVSGVLQGSRWGLQGVEDLGGGTKAIFLMESGFDANTGKNTQGGLPFGRRVYVGLSDEKIGTLTAGRQYDDVVDYPGTFAERGIGGGYVASHPGDIDNFNNGYRTNNAIKYQSPTFGGFRFGALYSLGGVPGAVSRNRIWSVGAGYKFAGLALGAGYINVRNPNISYFGNSSTTAPSVGSANVSSPVYSGFVSARTYQVIAGGGSYTLGRAVIGATYSHIGFLGLGDTTNSGVNPSGYAGSASFNNEEVNFRYRFTTAFTVTAAYDFMESAQTSALRGQNNGAIYQQGALSADYAFSKTTDVYVIAVFQHASGTDSRDRPAVASINGLTPSTSNSQSTVHFGVRHRF